MRGKCEATSAGVGVTVSYPEDLRDTKVNKEDNRFSMQRKQPYTRR